MIKKYWKYKVVEYIEDENNPGNAKGFDAYESNTLDEVVNFYRLMSKVFPDRCYDIVKCDDPDVGYYYLTRKQLLDIIAAEEVCPPERSKK